MSDPKQILVLAPEVYAPVSQRATSYSSGYRRLWARDLFHLRPYRHDFDGTGPLAAIKRWLVGLAAPVFGPDTDIVNVAAHFTEYLVFGGCSFWPRGAHGLRWVGESSPSSSSPSPVFTP